MRNSLFPLWNSIFILLICNGDSVLLRRKRQSRNNGQCSNPQTPESASVTCTRSSGRLRSCTARCLPSYVFDIQPEESEITLNCIRGRWRPAYFPECIEDETSECLGLVLEGSARYNCTSSSDGTQCDIYCDGTYESRYHCYPGRGWRPTLPYCTKPRGVTGPSQYDCRCMFGGTCDENGDCICTPRRTGQYCEEWISEQSRYDCRCMFGGTCDELGICVCPNERTGQFCEESITCEDPGQVSNGVRLSNDGSPSPGVNRFAPGQFVVYECLDDYLLSGRSLLNCLENGQWSNSRPMCTRNIAGVRDYPIRNRASCPYPGVDDNGRVRGREGVIYPSMRNQSFPFGTELIYECNEGYRIQGPSVLFCLPTGWWSNVAPSCTFSPFPVRPIGRITCENLGPITNGRIEIIRTDSSQPVSDSLVDDIEYPTETLLQYSCDEGYTMRGRRNLICQSNGYWSPPEAPICVEDCGRSMVSMTHRLAHANTTVIGEWPWTVAISRIIGPNRTSLVCGGALLDGRTVLTAAHCLTDDLTYIFYFGKFKRYNLDDDNHVLERRVTSSRLILHPEYNNVTYANDIAVVRIEERVPYSERVQPICLPTPESTAMNLRVGTEGIVTGWGITEHHTTSEELLKAELPVQSMSVCNVSFIKNNLTLPDHPGTFCSGYEDGVTGTCRGDSGSPLVFFDADQDRYTIEGLVSYSLNGECGMKGLYTVMTRVAYYMPWILENWN